MNLTLRPKLRAICTIVIALQAIVLFGSGCSKIDESNQHLDSMDQNTKQMSNELESYKKDVARMATSIDLLSQSLAELQKMSSKLMTVAMEMMFPEAPAAVVSVPATTDVLKSLPFETSGDSK